MPTALFPVSKDHTTLISSKEGPSNKSPWITEEKESTNSRESENTLEQSQNVVTIFVSSSLEATI